jgi:predicted PurR-regulated permease PerM
MQQDQLKTLTRWVFIGTAGCLILYFGKALFIPVSFSLLISFLLYPLCRWLEGKGLSRSLAIAGGLLLITILICSVVVLLVNQFSAFQHSWAGMSSKMEKTLDDLSIFLTENFGITPEGQKEWFKKAGNELLSTLGSALFNSGAFLAVALIIPVYAALILYNRSMLVGILLGQFKQEERKRVISVLHKVIGTYYNFIKGMLVVYLCVGLLNSIGLWILGIPQAFLFGFIASVLTFIPYVGIMIASLLPISVAWITKDSLWYPLGVVGVFAFVQYLEANVIFPMAVSSRLKINTLVTLLVMFAGGILWGAAGMILFIPFLAIAKLIADEMDPQGSVARMLGNGD